MSIYDYSYNYFNFLVPVYRRLPKTLALVQSWLKPLEWLRNNVWNYMLNGSSGYQYDNSVTYSEGQIVNYGGNTYECILATIGNLPTDTTYFTLVASNMIGWNERFIYNGRKKPLEYMLYRYFSNYDLTINFSNTTPNTSSNNSIYIETIAQSTQFISYTTFASEVFTTGIGNAVFSTYSASTYQFTINVPNSVATAIGGTTKTDYIINSLVKKYVIVGINYQIIYY